MHASSELRQWFLEWLDGDSGKLDEVAVTKLKALRLARRIARRLLPARQAALALRCVLR